MRLLLRLMLLALCGCGDSAPSPNSIEPARGSAEVRIADAEWVAKEAQAAADQALASKSASEARATQEKIALASANYWNRCIDINNQSVASKSDLWFKNFRPEAIEVTCRTAASKLRALQTTSVAPEVVDHVNRVIRGFETIGAIAKVKGRESLLRDAGDTLKLSMRLQKEQALGLSRMVDGSRWGLACSRVGGWPQPKGRTKRPRSLQT